MVQLVIAFDIDGRATDGEFAIQAWAIAFVAQGVGEGPLGARQARRVAGNLVQVQNMSAALAGVFEQLRHDRVERFRQSRQSRDLGVRIVIVVGHACLPCCAFAALRFGRSIPFSERKRKCLNNSCWRAAKTRHRL